MSLHNILCWIPGDREGQFGHFCLLCQSHFDLQSIEICDWLEQRMAQHPAQHLCQTSPPQSGQHPATFARLRHRSLNSTHSTLHSTLWSSRLKSSPPKTPPLRSKNPYSLPAIWEILRKTMMIITIMMPVIVILMILILTVMHICISSLKFDGRGWGPSFCEKNSETPT